MKTKRMWRGGGKGRATRGKDVYLVDVFELVDPFSKGEGLEVWVK